jgi:hypothetical protein
LNRSDALPGAVLLIALMSLLLLSTHLPGSSFAMLAHLLPKMLWAAMIAASSSAVNGPFFTLGLSWFSHLRQQQGCSKLLMHTGCCCDSYCHPALHTAAVALCYAGVVLLHAPALPAWQAGSSWCHRTQELTQLT